MDSILNMLNKYFRDEIEETKNEDTTQGICNDDCIALPSEVTCFPETSIEQTYSQFSSNVGCSTLEDTERVEVKNYIDGLVEQKETELTCLSEEQKVELIKQVLDDSSIKAVESPFRIYNDDRQEFEKNIPYMELTRVVQQYQNHEISDRMINILEIIILHKNITSKQIWQIYLLQYGKYIKRNHLNTTLDHMVNLGLITQFKMFSTIGKSDYYVYTPGYNGVRLHKAIKDNNISWQKTGPIQKVYDIKKCLAANQFLIAFLKSYELSYCIHKKLMWTQGNGVEKSGAVCPSLELMFKSMDENVQENIVFLVEVIRKYKGWESDFKEKLQRYAMYLKSVADTQVLKKYYIIICCESDNQIGEACYATYEVTHVNHIDVLKDSMIYFVSDLNLLDGNIKSEVLHNLCCFEYTNGEWERRSADFRFQKKEVSSLYIENDRIAPPIASPKKVKGNTSYCSQGKQELAFKIYSAIQQSGLCFPISVTKAAIPLKDQGIHYQEMGYGRLKDMLGDLKEYYGLYHKSPTELFISLTEKMQEIINGEVPVISEPESQQSQKDIYDADNVVKQYFANGLTDRKKWNHQFRNEIFVRNRDMCAAVLSRITNIYDFSAEGWLNIIAYSFQLAKENNNFMQKNGYLCFETGIYTIKNEKIYLLAEKNIRVEPKWVLLGLTTANSTQRLGDILREEFSIK